MAPPASISKFPTGGSKWKSAVRAGIFAAFTLYVLSLGKLYYAQVRYVVQTPKGKRFRYYSQRWKGGQRAFGNVEMGLNYPIPILCCHYRHWTYVDRSFPVTSQAASEVHAELYVENPKDATQRAKAAQANKTLG